VPVETLTAFRDHGKARPSLESDLEGAKAILADLEAAGISLRTVTDDLITDGIKKFQEPYDKMVAALAIR
jgi:transaldolase